MRSKRGWPLLPICRRSLRARLGWPLERSALWRFRCRWGRPRRCLDGLTCGGPACRAPAASRTRAAPRGSSPCSPKVGRWMGCAFCRRSGCAGSACRVRLVIMTTCKACPTTAASVASISWRALAIRPHPCRWSRRGGTCGPLAIPVQGDRSGGRIPIPGWRSPSPTTGCSAPPPLRRTPLCRLARRCERPWGFLGKRCNRRREAMTQNATICVGTLGQGIWRSSDGGDTWLRVRLGIPRVTALVVDPVDHQHIWAGLEVDGVRHSKDGGKTWEVVTSGVTDPDIHNLAITVGPPKTLLTITPREIFTSTDNGATWEPVQVRSQMSIPYCRGVLVKADDPR